MQNLGERTNRRSLAKRKTDRKLLNEGEYEKGGNYMQTITIQDKYFEALKFSWRECKMASCIVPKSMDKYRHGTNSGQRIIPLQQLDRSSHR